MISIVLSGDTEYLVYVIVIIIHRQQTTDSRRTQWEVRHSQNGDSPVRPTSATALSQGECTDDFMARTSHQ